MTILALALLLQQTQGPALPTGDTLTKQAYVLSSAKAVPTPKVIVDTSAAPDLAEWGKISATLMEQWYPIVWNLLGTDQSKPVDTIKVTFQLKQDAPAYATGGGIFVSIPWVRSHPDDFGMMIHEMTHLIQAYPNSRSNPGWLVEGVADYIRWWRYEPEAPRTKITANNKYTDAYRVTAYFLAYLTHKYDHGLVRTLDKAMKTRAYSDELFEKSTGKKLDALWAEFVATQVK